MADTPETTLAPARDLSELVSAIEPELAREGNALPRSTLTKILEKLEALGHLTFDRPIEAADHARVVRALERSGFRVSKRPESGS